MIPHPDDPNDPEVDRQQAAQEHLSDDLRPGRQQQRPAQEKRIEIDSVVDDRPGEEQGSCAERDAPGPVPQRLSIVAAPKQPDASQREDDELRHVPQVPCLEEILGQEMSGPAGGLRPCEQGVRQRAQETKVEQHVDQASGCEAQQETRRSRTPSLTIEDVQERQDPEHTQRSGWMAFEGQSVEESSRDPSVPLSEPDGEGDEEEGQGFRPWLRGRSQERRRRAQDDGSHEPGEPGCQSRLEDVLPQRDRCQHEQAGRQVGHVARPAQRFEEQCVDGRPDHAEVVDPDHALSLSRGEQQVPVQHSVFRPVPDKAGEPGIIDVPGAVDVLQQDQQDAGRSQTDEHPGPAAKPRGNGHRDYFGIPGPHTLPCRPWQPAHPAIASL